MSDIVERLREWRDYEYAPGEAPHEDLTEAADEIERLMARVAEVEYWNRAVAVCGDHVQDIVALDPKLCVICDEEKLRDALREIRDLIADDSYSIEAVVVKTLGIVDAALEPTP